MERQPRRRLNPHLGMEIDCHGLDLMKPMGKEDAKFIFQQAVEHKVLVLRNTGLEATSAGSKAYHELCREFQIASLEGSDAESKEKLHLEYNYPNPFSDSTVPSLETPGLAVVGPFPNKKGVIGNTGWHMDGDYCTTPCWFTCLRMSRLPQDTETGDVFPCGDTMFADATVAWDDLPAEEKEFLSGLKTVNDWKVSFPGVGMKAKQGIQKYIDRIQKMDELYPSTERPLVRKHPVTGRLAAIAGPWVTSHIVDSANQRMSQEQTREIFLRLRRLCEVPEYQLRVSWRDPGTVIFYDNYAVYHRVVADFYQTPPESRMGENIGTRMFPLSYNVNVHGVEIDDSHTMHADAFLNASGGKYNATANNYAIKTDATSKL